MGLKSMTAVLPCLLASLLASGTIASEPHYEVALPGACRVRAQAYRDTSYSGNDKFRYALDIVPRPGDPYRWDFTTAREPDYHYTSLRGGISPAPYGAAKRARIPVVLHQYDIYEERVTFENLNLGPLPNRESILSGLTPRLLDLKEPITRTTPSGISITLPVQWSEKQQGAAFYFGNQNSLFIPIEITPDQRLVTLPRSPLYRKHPKAASIKLECAPPHSMNSSMADNTYKVIAVSMPDLRTATRIDKLTLIIRQRVELRTIPVTLNVPITKEP